MLHNRGGTARRAAALTAALAGIACLAVACSSPKSPAAARSSASNPATEALAYSHCMRSHGISDFPDPKINSNGNGSSIGLSVGGGKNSDLNPQSPAFQAAQRACRKLAPGGGPGQAPTAQDLAAAVKFGACMRAHGYPSFPGPDGQGGFVLPGSINSNSAQFNSAANTCRTKTNLHMLNIRQTQPNGGAGSGS